MITNGTTAVVGDTTAPVTEFEHGGDKRSRSLEMAQGLATTTAQVLETVKATTTAQVRETEMGSGNGSTHSDSDVAGPGDNVGAGSGEDTQRRRWRWAGAELITSLWRRRANDGMQVQNGALVGTAAQALQTVKVIERRRW